jgi:hypothetical protein
MDANSETSKKIVGEALETWIDAQRRAIELLLNAQQPGHPVDWGEGARWVTRIASLAQEWVVEYADPLRPTIFKSQGPTRKLMVDNPDVDYWFASLDDRETYRLSGNRGEAAAIGFTIGTDILRGAPGRTGTLGQYQLDDFALAPNGDFAIALSKEKQPGNWIALPDGAAQLSVRETFHDRTRERPAQLRIERVGSPLPPADWTPEIAAERIALAARWMLFVAHSCVAMWKGFSASVNVITGGAGKDHVEKQEDEVRSHSASDMAYMGGNWRVGPDQALRITIHPARGGARYWGIVLVSPWMESYEYRQRHVCTNDQLAARNGDGSWTVVIAHRDPGVPNWLDTGGRSEGYALIRWVLPATLPPNPSCELIELPTR